MEGTRVSAYTLKAYQVSLCHKNGKPSFADTRHVILSFFEMILRWYPPVKEAAEDQQIIPKNLIQARPGADNVRDPHNGEKILIKLYSLQQA